MTYHATILNTPSPLYNSNHSPYPTPPHPLPKYGEYVVLSKYWFLIIEYDCLHSWELSPSPMCRPKCYRRNYHTTHGMISCFTENMQLEMHF
jgi:hypothetical protein